MSNCPKCNEYINFDPITGIYFCTKCGYQGTFVIEHDPK